jgi:predicted amidohydrolase
VRIALLQGPAETPDPEAGLAAVADAAARAAAAGARLLVTPEMSLTGYAIGAERVAELAEPVPGPLTDRVAAIAAEHGLAIAVGLPVRTPAGVANTVVVVDADGGLLADYAKTHLYGDVDRDAFVPGDVGVVHSGWTTSPSGCWSATTSSSPRRCGRTPSPAPSCSSSPPG